MSNYGPEKVTDNQQKLMMVLSCYHPNKTANLILQHLQSFYKLFGMLIWIFKSNMKKSQPRWRNAHFESLFLVFHSQGDNYRKRLFIVFKPFWLSLSCILYSHKVPISDTSFGKCLESHASFNLATPLGWTGKCIKQRRCTILRKMQIRKLLVIWCCCTIPPAPKTSLHSSVGGWIVCSPEDRQGCLYAGLEPQRQHRDRCMSEIADPISGRCLLS